MELGEYPIRDLDCENSSSNLPAQPLATAQIKRELDGEGLETLQNPEQYGHPFQTEFIPKAEHMEVTVKGNGKKKSVWNLKEIQETEREDFIRNLDVAVRIRKFHIRFVTDWLLDHPASPKVFKEKLSTEIGRRQAAYLLQIFFHHFKKYMKKADYTKKNQHRSKDNHQFWNQFYYAQFQYPEWNETTIEKGNFYMAKLDAKKVEAQLETKRKKTYLNDVANKMKEMIAKPNFPPPSEETMQSLTCKNNEKELLDVSLASINAQIKAAKRELTELAELQKNYKIQMKNSHAMKIYWDKKKTKLTQDDDLVHKYQSSVRNKKNASEKLQYEKNQLILLKEDSRILSTEIMYLNVKITDFEDRTINGLDLEQGSKIYRNDVCEVISDIIDSGVDYENIQSLFDTIFGAINHEFVDFPSSECLQRRKRKAKQQDFNPLKTSVIKRKMQKKAYLTE